MPEMILKSDILVQNAVLMAIKLEESNEILEKLEETQQKQEEVLKLKSVDQDSLKMVVQL